MMNKMLFILLIIALSNSVKAEIWPTFSIVELAINSDRIVVGKYLNTINGDSSFLIEDINNTKTTTDTLLLHNFDKLFYDLDLFEKSDSIIIFLTNNQNVELAWSGIRILKDNKIYLPIQNINLGKFRFGVLRDVSTWIELKSNIIKVQKRIDHIKELRTEKDNRELFKWINKNKHEFILPSMINGSNKNIGWGSFGWDVFKWITEKNIATDTWKASKLFRKVHFPDENKWLGGTGLLGDFNGTSFTSYKEIKFLISESLNKRNSIVERRQALTYLVRASRKVYENNTPIPDSELLDKQKDKQRYIRNKILPLLNNQKLKIWAFQVVRGMSNPMDGNLNHRIDLDDLPIIIKCYQNEEPGEYKSDLAAFIVHNMNKQDWKKLTTNDESIWVDLYHIYIDTSKMKLTCNIAYKYSSNYSTHPILEAPTIFIENINSNSVILKKTISDFKTPYHKTSSYRSFVVDLLEIGVGEYKIYVKGRAGENSEFVWKSEYGIFKIK